MGRAGSWARGMITSLACFLVSCGDAGRPEAPDQQVVATTASTHDIVFPHMDFAKHSGAILLHSSTAAFPGAFILDTGASDRCFDTRFQGVLRPTGTQRDMTAASGSLSLPGFDAPGITFATWSIPGPTFCHCLSLDMYSRVMGENISGFLGMSDIDHHVITLDYDADTLTLGRGSPVTDPTTPQANLPLLRIPDDNVRFVELTVADRPLRYLIDTGDSGTLSLVAEEFDRYVAHGEIVISATGHSSDAIGLHAERIGLLSSLTCGPFVYPPLKVKCGISTAAGGQNAIGTGFLSRHDVVLDLIHDIVHLRQRIPARSDPDRVNITGLHIWLRASKVEAAFITAGSPAALTGLMPGDLLDTLNGHQVTDFTLDELRTLIEQYPDQPLFLRIHRPSDHTAHDFAIKANPKSD